MARFYASIQGNRGMATRMGSNGISGHIRGWHTGVRVDCRPASIGKTNKTLGDVCYVYATGGSSGAKSDRLIAIVDEKGIHRPNFKKNLLG